MFLERFVNSAILGFMAVNVKGLGNSYKKKSHNVIMANKPIKKDWSKWYERDFIKDLVLRNSTDLVVLYRYYVRRTD